MDKPQDIFNRGHEWAALDAFVSSGVAGSTLGLVYGRRRQGKTFLLEALTEASGGFYFAALKQADAQNLERLAAQYQTFTRSRAGIRFRDWDEAFAALLALGERASSPVPVILDEFPYLLDGAPELPSLLQAHLSPRGKAVKSWRTRLVLCGSALSTMRGMLSGTAPLRGRASLELFVHPFDYRDAAAFWEVDHDPDLAMRLHALVGGTAAYRDMCGGTAPNSGGELDDWVVAKLLDPASAMFREGNVLLSEEEKVVDAAVYFAVLGAVSNGKTRRSEIAAAIGKSEGALAHPLGVLTQARLIATLDDAFKQKRTTYHIAEPVLRLHQLVIAPNEARLSRHHGTAVWGEVSDTVGSKIYGPHFEHLARVWCAEHAAPGSIGGQASDVMLTKVACQEHRCNHEIDVVALETSSNAPNRIIAIGEAKWRSVPCSLKHLRQLEHLRSLLRLPDSARLLLFSRSGFDADLTAEAVKRSDLELIDTDRLYHGS